MTRAIAEVISPVEIVFPRIVPEFNQRKEIFMNRFGFPGTIGCIDGTHVAILKPVQDAHNYLNRKGYYSLNVQIICDADLKILSVNANYPGANHDSYIWRQSIVCNFLLQQYLGNILRGTWLIGDSGYPLQPFLMIPFLNPLEGSPEFRYNQHHIRARNCVERCIGVLKCRFRALLQERTARYEPDFVGLLVNSCAGLHNLCTRFNVPLLDGVREENDVFVPQANPNVQDLQWQGNNIRGNIVNRYFT